MRWELYSGRPVKSAKSVAFPLGLNPLKSDTECKCSASPHETAYRRRHEGTCRYARQLQNIKMHSSVVRLTKGTPIIRVKPILQQQKMRSLVSVAKVWSEFRSQSCQFGRMLGCFEPLKHSWECKNPKVCQVLSVERRRGSWEYVQMVPKIKTVSTGSDSQSQQCLFGKDTKPCNTSRES